MLQTVVAVLVAAGVVGCGNTTAAQPPAVRQVESARQSGMPTVVEFGSEACASCRTMQRVMAGVARKAERRAQVLVMDILKQDGLIGEYRIKVMPTQVFFDAAGRETGRHMGVLTEADVLARLQVKEP